MLLRHLNFRYGVHTTQVLTPPHSRDTSIMLLAPGSHSEISGACAGKLSHDFCLSEAFERKDNLRILLRPFWQL
jgi:hypothetical protein